MALKKFSKLKNAKKGAIPAIMVPIIALFVVKTLNGLNIDVSMEQATDFVLLVSVISSSVYGAILMVRNWMKNKD